MSPYANSDSPLRAFREPASVAVVGASTDPAKWGYWIARGALRGASRRRVHLVNQRDITVDGVASSRRLGDLPDPPELAVLCVPPDAVGDVVDEGLAVGVRAFCVITAGVGNDADSTIERQLARRVRAAGARLLGPNCLGLFDAQAGLHLAWGKFTDGSLGIASQSGQLGLELASLAADAGIGVSRFVSLGNQADVTAEEVLADLADHPATRVVAVYLESFRNGRALADTLRGLREAGKPVLLMTVGGSEASRGAARSHTGSLTSSSDVVDAASRAAGCLRLATPAEVVDAAQFVLEAPLPRGRRVVILGDSGGQGAVAADLLSEYGLEIPPLSPAVAGTVAASLPPWASARNPVDLAGQGEQDLTTYARLVGDLTSGDEADAVLLTGYFGAYGADEPSLQERELDVVARIGDAVREHGKPVVVHSMGQDSAAVRALRENGVPTYHTVDGAARALGAAVALAHRTGRAVKVATAAVPLPSLDGYWSARRLLSGAGVPFPEGMPARDRAAAVAAATRLRPPYVLKAGWLDHKTEAGGVVLNLADPESVGDAYERLCRRLGPGDYVVEEQDTRTQAVELLVGVRRDPSFGALVVVGIGGAEAELLGDVVLELAPVDHATALGMLRGLRRYPLLCGWRGRPSVDEDAVARAIADVSHVAAAHDDIVEGEINPLRAGPDGVLAVDALLIGASTAGRR